MRKFSKLRTTMILVFVLVLVSALCLSLYAAPVTVGNFTVDYVIQSSWGSGATINVTLKNNGPAVTSWTVGWTYPGNQTITNMWNASYTQSGASVTVKNLDYNASIPTNGSISFGFNINYSGSNSAPTSFTVNSSTSNTPTPTQGGIATPTPIPTVGPGTPTPTPAPTTATISAFSQIEAESYNTQSGIQTESCGEGGQNIGYIENGDYTVYNNINFGSGATGFQARVASSTSGGNIEIRLDSISGSLVGTCSVPGTGGWQTWTTSACLVSGTSGTHNLYLKFTGGSGYLFNVNWFKFTTGSVETPTSTPISTPTPTQTPTTAGKFHCFLLLGQSNMAGYPKAQDSDKVEDPRVLVLGYDNNAALGRVTDQWDVACPPLHETYQGAIGPGDWFAKTLIQKVPAGDTIGLIPCAISGEKIETFMKVGGSKYSWIINRAKLAQQKGGVIEGILFHQGESNNGDTSWPGKVKTLVQDLKNDLNLGNVPFIAGELLYSGSCAGHNTLVNQLPSVITNCYVVSASGLVVDPADTQWKLHFGHDSQVEFGKRYAAKMIQALGW